MGDLLQFKKPACEAKDKPVPILLGEEAITALFMTPWRQLEICSNAYLNMSVSLEKAAREGGEFLVRRCRRLLVDYLDLRSRLFWEMIPVMERLVVLYADKMGEERLECANKAIEVVFIALMEAELIGNRVYVDIDEQLNTRDTATAWLTEHVLTMAHILERMKSFYAWFSEILAGSDEDNVQYCMKAVRATWRVMEERYRP